MNSFVLSVGPSISALQSFYSKAKFTVVSEQPLIVSDGSVCIELSEYKFHRSGFKFYRTEWDVSSLQEMTHVTEIDGGYLLSDPSGIWIYLMEGTSPVMKQYTDMEKSILGNFGGGSTETTDMQRSLDFYAMLGFEKTMGGMEQGWIAMTNKDGFSLSIMKPLACPHVFHNPSLSYFNGGKNLPVIERIRKVGIEITQEITEFNPDDLVDNIIIRDPAGYGFFIFND